VVLDLQAQTVPLRLEFKPEKRLVFVVAASAESPSPQTQQLVVINPLTFAFEFSLVVEPPILFSVHPPKDLVSSTGDSLWVLPPGKSAAFTFELNLKALQVAGPAALEDSDTEAVARFVFPNGTSQIFPLLAKVRHARLTCPEVIDFGSVLVGATRTLMATINNLTTIGAHWMVVALPSEAFSFQ
jgi:hypothetical protein